MGFIDWDPWHDLVTIREGMSRLCDGAAGVWSPAVDLFEAPDRYIIVAEVPGLSREDIEIQTVNGRLIVRGVRRSEALQQYQRVERGYGSFRREFSLPGPAVPDRVSASLEQGLLTIVIVKASLTEPRRIEVR